MPVLSIFYGIRVSINYDEHNPPHFRAEYVGYNVSTNILDATVQNGYVPKRQLKLLLAWAELHKDELMQNWELSRNHEELLRIEPLK